MQVVQKGDPEREVLGRSQGGFSTNFPPRAEGGGRPLAILLTAGQRHEAVVFEALLEQSNQAPGARSAQAAAQVRRG